MLNNVILMGRFTTAPELKYTASDIVYLKFCLALDRPGKKDTEKRTDFIGCSAWRGAAEFICNYFNKGDLIAVEGRLQTNIQEKEDGSKRKFTDVLVNKVHFCGGTKKETAGEGIPEFEGSDLPF